MAANTMKQNEVNLTKQESTSRSTGSVMMWLSSGLMLLAAVLMVASIAFPYWGLVLEAPQYPGGLEMRVFLNYMTGDDDPRLDEVREIDGLNHYIGMKSLYDAAQFERSIALPGMAFMVISLVVVAFWRKRWIWLLAIPAIAFPFIYIGDLALWMTHYGQNLDPYAPLSSAIKPFTPTVIGEGIIGQFRTVAGVQLGWWLTLGASALVLAALVMRLKLHRQAQQES